MTGWVLDALIKHKKNHNTMFWKKKETEEPISKVTYFAPLPPLEVAKIQTMLSQVTTWIKAGETELAAKYWILISEECRKYGTEKRQ